MSQSSSMSPTMTSWSCREVIAVRAALVSRPVVCVWAIFSRSIPGSNAAMMGRGEDLQ